MGPVKVQHKETPQIHKTPKTQEKKYRNMSILEAKSGVGLRIDP